MLNSKILNEVKNKLKVSVRKNYADGLLFSGGLDTSVLAILSPGIIGINISLENYSYDVKYAKLVEKFLNMKVYYQTIKIEEAINSVPEIIKILKTFDPAIPNDISVYFGLKFAKTLGLKSIMTGDGADELFAGYDFMEKIENLDSYIRKIAKNMYFSSNELGKSLGIEIKQPYIDKEFRVFSLKIPPNLKIKKVHHRRIGKWILRKAFESLLPKEIIWQDKRPLEYGSGMTKLREIISRQISDDEFKEKQKIYPIRFMNKEHLYYYEIYKKVVGKIPKPQKTEKRCPACGGGMGVYSSHCKICGGIIN